jgi:ABC-type Fe3+ transport system permease subunit
MENTSWSWETHFDIDSLVLLKILVVLIIFIWIRETLRRREERQDPGGAISQANARERHQWRYVRWVFILIQTAFGLYMLGSLIQFLLR